VNETVIAVGSASAVIVAVLAGLGLRRKMRTAPLAKPIDPADRALVNLLIALGHDPTKILVQAVREGRKKGIRVLTRDGKPLRYYTLQQLGRLKKDKSFLMRYEAARSQ
jgi:hypothetical protein